jgi:hypothetical protein
MEVAGGREIVGSMDESFEGFVHSAFGGAEGFVVAWGGDEFLAKEILSVHQMNWFARAEGGFQLGVVGLPRDYLSIGARKVRVNYDLAGVRDEHLPDVREPKLALGIQIGGWW